MTIKTRKDTIEDLIEAIRKQHRMITYGVAKMQAGKYLRIIEERLEDYKWKSIDN